MPLAEQPLTIGIEKEYLLVDLESRDLRVSPSDELLHECEALLAPGTGGVRRFLRPVRVVSQASFCGRKLESKPLCARRLVRQGKSCPDCVRR